MSYTPQFELLNTYFSKLACKMSYTPKITAFTAMQYINYINNKPIGRVKYALA